MNGDRRPSGSQGEGRTRAAAVVAVYVVVLDLFVEYLPPWNRAFTRFLGPRVGLGGFFPVTLLILVLMLARALVRRLLRSGAAGGPG